MIIKKIESIMTDKGESPFFSFESVLSVLSILYGGAVKLRETFYKKGFLKSEKLPCKVISVGNLTVGGTGKTPVTICLAEMLNSLGYKVAVLSRGYRGKEEKHGGIVSDGHRIFMDADMAGDEPFMMASNLKNIPVIVGKNRFESGMLAVKEFQPDIIVLDDAFQHLRLRRDINLVLSDYHRPFGNKHLLPRGTLREPLSALLRGDAFILTGTDDGPGSPISEELGKMAESRPVFRAFHIPYICKTIAGTGSETFFNPDGAETGAGFRRVPGNSKSSLQVEKNRTDTGILKGCSVFAFSGIAKNKRFHKSVESLGGNISGAAEFPDHHRYSENDFSGILRSAAESGADILVTTEKDHARIRKVRWPIDLAVIGIKISFGDDENRFVSFIQNRLSL
ncbi:tetraacyldisaccharide 4'-kinase [Desulfococcaceae bacterium HSG8]|nr:tetraacyldisaccharide 4'-kinase [Desulfococcaceae bacterium HSG8]